MPKKNAKNKKLQADADIGSNKVQNEEIKNTNIEKIQSQVRRLSEKHQNIDNNIREETEKQSSLQAVLKSQQRIMKMIIEEEGKRETIKINNNRIVKLNSKLNKIKANNINNQNEILFNAILKEKGTDEYQQTLKIRNENIDNFNRRVKKNENSMRRRMELNQRYQNLLKQKEELKDLEFLENSFAALSKENERMSKIIKENEQDREYCKKLDQQTQEMENELQIMQYIEEQVESKEQEILNLKMSPQLTDRYFSQDAQIEDEIPFYQDVEVQTESPIQFFKNNEDIIKEINELNEKNKTLRYEQAKKNLMIINSLKSWKMQNEVLTMELDLTIKYFEELGKK